MKRYNNTTLLLLPNITSCLLLTVVLLFRNCSVVVLASNLRIMPLGDSITFGKGTPGGYRSSLYYGLKTKGYDVNFVGSQVTNCIWGEQDVNMDCNHEGHLAWTIDMTREHIQQILDQSPDPDAILLMIGTMDLMGNDFNSAIDRWTSLIHKIVELRPHTHIFASNLIKRRDVDLSNTIDQYFNAHVEDVVQNFNDDKKLVHFVDMNKALNDVDFIDAMNLSTEGYDLMAKEWLSHITNIFQPSGDNYPPSIIRAVGSEDRYHVTITFSKSLGLLSSNKDNFEVDNNLEILDATLDDDERSLILTTSEQDMSTIYTITVLKGIYDQSSPPIMTDPQSSSSSSVSFRVGWRFLVLSDWHNAEKYIFGKRPKDEVNDIQVISYLKQNFGGELILASGDTNSGVWYPHRFSKALNNMMGSKLKPAEVIMEAGRRCYSGLMKSFRLGGFWNLIMAVGDHELGDNPWNEGSLKSKLVLQYRRAFADNINMDYDGNFRFQEKIGDVESRPFSTQFSETSYAYIHKNVLFVTIDEWYQKSPNSNISKRGTVVGTMSGKHLEWFDNVLTAGRAHPKVKHIFVQGHLPILLPVRKVKSSGMALEDGTNSLLWKTMQKHKVDIYWAGEVHLNTVSKDPDSNLIQVVNRGNYFSNFFTVDVTDDLITLECHSETGTNTWMYNYDYESCGSLQLRKENDELRIIESTGDLAVLDPSKPLIHFDFEETYPLQSRKIQQLGGMTKSVPKTPTVQKVYIEEIACTKVLPNIGQFGINYDAQMNNIALIYGRNGKVGRFDIDSRAAVWGMGPHSEGNTVSFALWFRTDSSGSVILISYEGYWMRPTVMNLRLQEGTIEMVYSETQKIRGVGVVGGRSLNDGLWHHVAISMPDDNCFLSEIFLYIDGEQANTKTVGSDTTVYLPRGGQLALGGFGYGGTSVETPPDRNGFRDGINFLGEMDDVMVWSRTLELSEVQNMAKVISNSIRSSVSEDECIGLGPQNEFQTLQLLPCNNFPVQRWIMDFQGYIHNQKYYDYCIGLMNKNTAVGTNVVLTKCSSSDDTFRWSYLDKGLIQLSDYPDLVMSSDDDGYIRILPYGSADNKVWIIGKNKKKK